MRATLILSLFFILCSCGEKNSKILPEKTRITESVYASATLQPDSLYHAHASITGILDSNLVDEGDSVLQGQPILKIKNTAPKLNVENARLAWQLARENYSGNAAVLKGIQDEIDAALLSLHNDSLNYFRQKRLWENSIGSKVELDNRRLAYELSQNKVALLKSSYERTQKELLTRLQQTENDFKTSQVISEDFVVTSKIKGTVYALFKNPGEIVSAMEPLASVGHSTNYVINLQVDEVDIVKLKLEQEALITIDAYKSDVFKAKITKIYPSKDERAQAFTVEAIFTDPPDILYPGLAGEGNIIIAEKENVLTIPKEYLTSDNQVKTENGMVDVTTGLQSLDRIEIISGLEANSYILKPAE